VLLLLLVCEGLVVRGGGTVLIGRRGMLEGIVSATRGGSGRMGLGGLCGSLGGDRTGYRVCSGERVVVLLLRLNLIGAR
jgi:hypothetical protein